jgi:hypothetical protein
MEMFVWTTGRFPNTGVVTITGATAWYHINIRAALPAEGATMTQILTRADGDVFPQNSSCSLVGDPRCEVVGFGYIFIGWIYYIW